jgi:hypothetical protein
LHRLLLLLGIGFGCIGFIVASSCCCCYGISLAASAFVPSLWLHLFQPLPLVASAAAAATDSAASAL